MVPFPVRVDYPGISVAVDLCLLGSLRFEEMEVEQSRGAMTWKTTVWQLEISLSDGRGTTYMIDHNPEEDSDGKKLEAEYLNLFTKWKNYSQNLADIADYERTL